MRAGRNARSCRVSASVHMKSPKSTLLRGPRTAPETGRMHAPRCRDICRRVVASGRGDVEVRDSFSCVGRLGGARLGRAGRGHRRRVSGYAVACDTDGPAVGLMLLVCALRHSARADVSSTAKLCERRRPPTYLVSSCRRIYTPSQSWTLLLPAAQAAGNGNAAVFARLRISEFTQTHQIYSGPHALRRDARTSHRHTRRGVLAMFASPHKAARAAQDQSQTRIRGHGHSAAQHATWSRSPREHADTEGDRRSMTRNAVRDKEEERDGRPSAHSTGKTVRLHRDRSLAREPTHGAHAMRCDAEGASLRTSRRCCEPYRRDGHLRRRRQLVIERPIHPNHKDFRKLTKFTTAYTRSDEVPERPHMTPRRDRHTT